MDDDDATSPFMKDKRWKSTFLPSLTHKLFIAAQAFVDFKADSQVFLQTVQEVFDVSYPNIEYRLEQSDKLVTTVRISMLRMLLVFMLFT